MRKKLNVLKNTSLPLMGPYVPGRKIKTDIFLKTKTKPSDLKHSQHNF